MLGLSFQLSIRTVGDQWPSSESSIFLIASCIIIKYKGFFFFYHLIIYLKDDLIEKETICLKQVSRRETYRYGGVETRELVRSSHKK